MSTATTTTRDPANQRYLMAALGRVIRWLEDTAAARSDHDPAGPPRPDADDSAIRADHVDVVPPDTDREVEELRAALPGPAPLDVLCQAFGLSPFERDVLLLCAGVELDASFAELVTTIDTRGPTFGLALAALPDPHWSAIAPDAPLRRWRLVEVGSGDRLVASRLRIDERVLHYLTGVQGLDEQLRGFVHPLTGGADRLAPSQTATAEEVAAAWHTPTRPLPVLQLLGPAAECRAVARAGVARLGMALHAMPASVAPSGPHERDVLVRLWERESVLGGSALLIEIDPAGPSDPEALARIRHLLEATGAAILLSAPERVPLPHRPTLVFTVGKPTAAEQRRLWRSLMGDDGPALNGEVDRIAAQFDLPLSAIETAWKQAGSGTGTGTGTGTQSHGHEREGEELGRRLWAACRSQARPRLSHLAQRIVPAATWRDLVLPELQTRVLREIAVHVRRRLTVYDTWGFAAKSSRGLGISALFAGPSGTGKTMAAEVLAGELELDLYRIDLSRVVNKYIGETEKNLARVFDAAEEGGAILLFDEADALFGKRSEVKDSHDRYANIEVSYLLQRMEAYRGLAILTSNLKDALDDAFLRRLRFIVSFPFPDPAHRSEIWRRIFPPETPTEGLDPAKLGRLNVTGGHIRNIALGAAFLAADADRAVRMEDVLRAARTEYAKLERPLTDGEIRGWT